MDPVRHEHRATRPRPYRSRHPVTHSAAEVPPAVWQLTELREGESFNWVTKGPGVRAIARHGVEAIEGGCRATLSLEFAGPLGGAIGRLTSGLNERYLALEAAGLKKRSESR